MRHHCLTLSVCATLIVGLMADARACSIPVFRFALERWQADFYEVAVFHRGELTGSELQHVDRLEEAAVRNGGSANFEVVRCDVSGTVPPDLGKVLQSLGDVPLPQVVVRRPREGARQPELWRGRLSDLDVARFVDSPARRELSRRLLGGDAVVWLLVRGSDAKVADALRQSLDSTLTRLPEEMELPRGIGAPGSELRSNVPLQLKFSVLEVSRAEATEDWLLRMLLGRLPDELPPTDSCVAPAFGRGRVLDVFASKDVADDSIAELTHYLCGACSCQVKESNPGFDVLTSLNWDEQLFDPDAERPVIERPGEITTDGEATLVEIPLGSSESHALIKKCGVIDPPPPLVRLSTVLWTIGGLFALAVVLVASRR